MTNNAIKYLKPPIKLAICPPAAEPLLFSDRGISALLSVVSSPSKPLAGADVADTVVGKAAALLMIQGGVKRLHAVRLSEMAIPALSASDVEWEAEQIVPFILGRDGKSMCVTEQTVADISSPSAALVALQKRFASAN